MNRNIMIQLIATILITFSLVGQAFCICLPGATGDEGGSSAASSRDPNALTGPAGYGESHYVPFNTLLAYRVDFENDSSASAPAQQVDITNQLEANMDWQTFQITEIGFGDQFIAVPPGSRDYQTVIPMTFDGVTFDVHINVGIDLATGIIAANFFSIDHETGWTPPVNIGFLPPEDGTGRGMGHISYTIKHKDNLNEGTEIRNVALIVFDKGEQIHTNQIDPHDPSKGTDPGKEALVTIDSEMPSGKVTPLPETSGSVFTVSWAGSDSTSGIAGYDIYTREGQEVKWQLWHERTSETSAEFTGLPGHSYEFYSVAIDNVGHREQKDPVPDAKTLVNSVSDQDGDGVADATDNCPQVANSDQADFDGDGMGDLCDPDKDDDGVANATDNCLQVVNSDQADLDGDGIGDLCDSDKDGDGVANTTDNCPQAANSDQTDQDDDGIGNLCDPDQDGDGVAIDTDNCPQAANSDQADLDGNGIGDLCDPDQDGDGIANTTDNCALVVNSDQADLDGDGIGDLCDPDQDGDGVAIDTDNCALVANSDQTDLDGDGIGDLCDPDQDGDGLANATDNCPQTANLDQADQDGDAIGDLCDPDQDGDGVANTTDNCPQTANSDQTDQDDDGIGNLCDPDQDGDGVAIDTDNCPLVANADQADFDGDGMGDLCDACPNDADNDLDGDSVCGDVDNCPTVVNSEQADLDQDGIGDLCDPQTCGNNILETIEKCDDSNRIDRDGCSSQCIPETLITVSKAKVKWDDGSIEYKGSIRLPLGLTPYNVDPQSSVSIEIPNIGQVASDKVFFTVKGAEDKKWEFKNGTGSVQGFKIDWQGAKFDYQGLLHIKANYIGPESTSLEIDRGGLVGAFSIQIGEITIQVDADNKVTTLPTTLHVDNDAYDHEIEVDLPFSLTADMTIVISRPDFPDTLVPVADNLSYSTGKFDLRAKFDPAGGSGLDGPASLSLRITLGKAEYPGYAQISTGWKIIKDKEWKHED